ncbi:hypothetical protein ABZ470_31770 [Streptosporangium sp. NPDC020072]|uniref:hypothetical protein n=1 Tax=Streptosporangium sp. NPDC020072 TaxID=3154788 RepID=UPI0034269956
MKTPDQLVRGDLIEVGTHLGEDEADIGTVMVATFITAYQASDRAWHVTTVELNFPLVMLNGDRVAVHGTTDPVDVAARL